MSQPAPLSWVSGNVVYARSLRDPWAVFSVATRAHEHQARSTRLEAFAGLRDLLADLGRDFQLLRIPRDWDAAAYADELAEIPGPHATARGRYAAIQAAELAGLAAPGRLLLSISLKPAKADSREKANSLLSDPAEHVQAGRDRLRELSLGSGEPSPGQVDEHHEQAGQLLGQLMTFLGDDVAPASVALIEWAIRRRWTAGLGEPDVDGLDLPRALSMERNGNSTVRSLEVDVLGWTGAVRRGYRSLTLEGELGTSYQAGLVASTMPGDAHAGDEVLELFLGPADSLAFPIDIALCCSFIRPAKAQRSAAGEMAKADEAADEEHAAARGLSPKALARTEIARDAEAYLQDGNPLLESTFTIMVSAASARECEDRVREVRARFRAYGVKLRPAVAQQLQVLMEHLPAQRSWTKGFIRRLTVEQVAAMAPAGEHRLGGKRGYVWGCTPKRGIAVRWDPQDGSRLNTASGVLMVGEPGAGKTTAAAKLATEAFLSGARVFDFTAKKSDHHWLCDPLIAPHADVITLRARDELRGLLDPLVNAPDELAHDATVDFLSALLPRSVGEGWETELLTAVAAVRKAETAPTCTHVLRALHAKGTSEATRLAEHLEVQAQAGLCQLGFADPDRPARSIGDRQVTHLEVEGLPTPERGVSREQYEPMERQGAALVKLVALLGAGLMGRFPDEFKVFDFDEAKLLLDSPAGVKMLGSLQRLGRSKLGAPVLQTQYASDIGLDRDSVGGLFGTVMCFRAADESEARRSLQLLGAEETPERVQALTSAPSGRCLMRDHQGRIDWLDVILPSGLLALVNTNPHTRAAAAAGGGGQPR